MEYDSYGDLRRSVCKLASVMDLRSTLPALESQELGLCLAFRTSDHRPIAAAWIHQDVASFIDCDIPLTARSRPPSG